MALPAKETREGSFDGQIYTSMRPSSRLRLSPSLREFGRDCLIALSLANWTMLRVWAAILPKDPDFGYFLRHPRRPLDFAAAILGVCLLAALFLVAATVARRSAIGRVGLQWGAVLAIVLAGNAVKQVLASSGVEILPFASPRYAVWRHVAVIAGLAGICLWAALMGRWRQRVARIVSVALLVSSPFVVVTFSEAAGRILGYHPAGYADKMLAAPVQIGLPQRRVLWLIFDEMDERLAFVDRDPALQLPELDRFRATSFSAVDARSPADQTRQSIPMLLTGEVAVSVQPAAPDDLILHFAPGGVAHWQNEPNVFSRARAAGYDSALAGWYHPYGRMLNNSLTQCLWFEGLNAYNSKGDALVKVTMSDLRTLVETGAMSLFGQTLAERYHARNYRDILAAATAYAASPRLGMEFAHFPIPHGPYVYNSRTGRLDLANSPLHGYIDALALVDRTLGELRRTMEAAGLWERTAVLISADHGYRGVRSVDGGRIADRWVPFLLKLPGQHEPYEYPRRLETIRSAGLLLDILEGRVSTPADVARSLDELPSGPNSRLDRPK
jgi:hypothetical protein